MGRFLRDKKLARLIVFHIRRHGTVDTVYLAKKLQVDRERIQRVLDQLVEDHVLKEETPILPPASSPPPTVPTPAPETPAAPSEPDQAP